MSSNSFHFLKHPSMASSLFILLLILILLTTFSWFFFLSTPLTLLSLLLSTSFTFILSKLKPKEKPNHESSEEKKRNDRKIEAFQEVMSDELIVSDQRLTLGTGCSVFDSENSISDDENLIEIALPDGHYIGSGKTRSELENELHDYLPKSLFLQHGLMELLLEINEEDSMIEIDIAMGSIKCPSFEIKA